MGKSPIVKKGVITISFEIKNGGVTVSNNFTKRRQKGFKIGTRGRKTSFQMR